MLGLMDLRFDAETGRAEITDVVFDEPGGVDVDGTIKRRKKVEEEAGGPEPPFRLVLARKAALSLKKVARLVVAEPIPVGSTTRERRGGEL